MRLILDTSILLAHPEILSQGGPSVKFLLPQSVVREIGAGRVRGLAARFDSLLESASRLGRVRILPDPKDGSNIPLWKRLSVADTLILETALDYQNRHPEETTYLVSDDIHLVLEANKLGLKTATSKTVGSLIRATAKGDAVMEELSSAARSIDRYNRNYLIGAFLLGLAVSALLFVAWHFRGLAVHAFPVWGLISGAMIIGVFLFWFRCRFRLSYGVLELAFGVFTAGRLARPSTYDPTFFLQFAAALYIIVRGLDNVDRGITGTKIGPRWSRFFGAPNKT